MLPVFVLLGMSGLQLAGVIALAVAAGIIIAKLAMLVFSWIHNKIKQKLAKRNVSKVAVGELSEMIKHCENQITIGELDALEGQKTIAEFKDLQSQGITHFAAEIQDNGQIEQEGIEAWDVEAEDQKTRDLINKTHEGMVVVSA